MIIQLEPNITAEQKEGLKAQIASLKYKTNDVKTQMGEYIIGIGKEKFDVRNIGHLPGIKDIHIVSDDYKLVSRKWKVNRTAIDLGDGVLIGDGHFAMMAGPCSIEGEENIEKTIQHLKENDIKIMRGGAYKPREFTILLPGYGHRRAETLV